MEKKTVLGALLGLFAANCAFADEPQSVSISHIYAPQGYDDNDEITIMVDGYLPSTCYQLAPPTVQVDYSSRNVMIDIRAHVNAGPCVNVPVPFEQEVDVGSLAAGEWTVDTTANGPDSALLVDKASTSQPDEFLYAPVDRVEVSYDPNSHLWTARLSGDILATCLVFQETRLLEQQNVFVILPILAQNNEECLPTSAHFSKTIDLPANLPQGRYLVHVRSLNGRGVNEWLDVPRQEIP